MKNFVVTIADGSYRGVEEENGTISFRNIPYAKAERWQRCVPVEAHEGIQDATEFGPAPWQPAPDPFFAARTGEPMEFEQSEDCLNINVWVNDIETPKKAILMWIYGGSYIQGSNDKLIPLGESLVKRHPEVMIVAPNYRVGVLGSLNLGALTDDPKYKYSNNLAITDLLEALHWIHRNAEAFGGDVNNITLYGHSAGSNAASQLLGIKDAKGLFNKAICQSSYKPDLGTVSFDTSQLIADKFFELSGVKTLEEALALTPGQILKAQGGLFGYQYHGSRESKMFSPVIDGLVIREDDLTNMAKGEINASAIICGCSYGEYDQQFLAMNAAQTKENVIRRNSGKHVTAEDMDAFRAMHPEMTDKEAYMSVHNDLGLILAGEIIARVAEKHIPVWQYVFRLPEADGMRTNHGAPMNYVFGHLISPVAPDSLCPNMMDAWASFIVKGNPNHPGIPEWPQYHADGDTMCIDQNWVVEHGYWKNDFNMWKYRFFEWKELEDILSEF